MYLGLSLLVASRVFPLTHPTSFAITDGDPAHLFAGDIVTFRGA
jgi:hypothetical protein